MCGIFGYNFEKNDTLDRSFFDLLKHRGPDAKKSISVDNWTLGHLRLSIIDTNEVSNQPMESNGNFIIFNGEIFNFIELKEQYLSGFNFKTNSDTEVLLELLNKYGLKILNKLNGMFAFAYYNHESKKLFLCRDRFAIKPLHYTQEDEKIFFSSEIKPLIKVRQKYNLNKEIIDIFLRDTATDFDERTFIEEIFQVEAGHYVEIEDGNIKKVKWYQDSDFNFNKNIFKNYQRFLNFYEDLLTDAIKIRLRSDVPVCITLSGGLDSSAIYTLTKERLNEKIQPFTLSHPGSETDELDKAKKLAEKYGDRIIVVTNNENTGVKDLTESLNYLEFPIWAAAAPGFIETYKNIKKHGFTVVLEGHGSDEQLGGYPHHIDAAWKKMVIKMNFKKAFEFYKVYEETKNPALQQSSHSKRKIYFINMIIDFILNILREIKNPGSQNFFMQETLNKDFHYKILPIVLRAFDRMSMSQSTESRNPFMDHRLVEFTRMIPVEYKVGELGSKLVLREILKKYGADFIYKDKKKIGWSSDIPKTLNDIEVKKFLKLYINKFNFSDFKKLKKEAIKRISKNKIDWNDSDIIWKVASIGIIKDKYGKNQ